MCTFHASCIGGGERKREGGGKRKREKEEGLDQDQRVSGRLSWACALWKAEGTPMTGKLVLL